MKSKTLLIGALICAVAVLAVSLAPSGTRAAVEPDKTPVVFVRKAAPSEMFDVLTYPARVVPRVNANVLSESDGIVTQILSPLGRTVARRQRMMIVKNTDPVYQYAPVVISAPVSGVVSQVEVSEGSRVVKGQRLASVTDPAQIRVNVEIAAQDLGAIHPGLLAELRTPGRPETAGSAPATLEVLGVSPFVDPATGTATCELKISKPAPTLGPVAALPQLTLLPGEVGQVVFKVNVRAGISIPEYAVVYKGGDTFVKIVEKGKAKMIAITLGRHQRGAVEVLKGLASGYDVIERSSGFVGDGEAVKMENGA